MLTEAFDIPEGQGEHRVWREFCCLQVAAWIDFCLRDDCAGFVEWAPWSVIFAVTSHRIWSWRNNQVHDESLSFPSQPLQLVYQRVQEVVQHCMQIGERMVKQVNLIGSSG